MIEIIPNWHPIFVHFTVGLFSTAVGFYILAYGASFIRKLPHILMIEFEVVARWCLWAAALITILTVLAGLYAYNTVNHDAPSHLAMTNHRNWALPTALMMIVLALWSGLRYRKRKRLTLIFVIATLFVQAMLLATAWRGGELVFRYGLGVMSLPKAEGAGHHHQHDMPSMDQHEAHQHNHND